MAEPRKDSQHIRDIMTPNPKTVTEKDTVLEAARIMRDQDTGVIPVVEGRKIIGLVTDRDIVVRAVADGRDPSQVQVREICSADLEALAPDDDVDRAVQVMRERHVRRIPIVENGRPVGIVSIGDLAIERDEDSALADISAAPGNR
jgi:CBS domain-containing protein